MEELTLEAPLVLPAEGGVQLQVTVGAPDAGGRPAGERVCPARRTPADGPWTRHASGLLAPAGAPAGGLAAEFARVAAGRARCRCRLAGLYAGLAARGYGYGPAFRGLRAAWRRGEEVFAEVALPEEAAADAGPFGLHPALLDAALHAVGLGTGPRRPAEAGPAAVRVERGVAARGGRAGAAGPAAAAARRAGCR